MPTHKILITDRNCNVIGDPLHNWTTLDATLRFNQPGSGMFTVPGYQWIRDQVTVPGNRVVFVRDGQVLLAGPIESHMLERSDDGEHSGDGTLTVSFVEDGAWLAVRNAYPDPALTPEDQTTDEWPYSGNAETVMRSLVNLNAGPGARTERRVPKLVLGAAAGVGTTVSGSTRLEPCTDVLRSLALAGGGLGFRTVQIGKNIEFRVYEPEDKTGTVRFSLGLGNLKYLMYEAKAPTATTAIVGGQGEGADRYILQRTDTAAETAWGRKETLVSRPGSDPTAELQQAGDETLAEMGETARLQSVAADTQYQRFGVDYNIGDKVSVEVWAGFEVSDLVRLVHLQAWPTAGEVVSTTVGTQEAVTDRAWTARLRQIDRRVSRLERTVTSVP